MRVPIAPRFYALVGSLALFACLGGDGGGGDGAFVLEGDIKVTNINRTEMTMTTEATTYECEDGQLITEIDTTQNSYRIQDGKVVIWNEEDCTAMTLTGTSSDIAGTWKGTGLEMEDSIPANIPHTCIYTPDPDGSDSLFDDLSVTYTVTASNIHMRATGTVCMGPMVAELLLSQMPGATLVSQTCSEATVSVPTVGNVSMRGSVSGRKMVMTVTYNGKSCSLENTLSAPGAAAPDCAKQKQAEDAFDACTEGLFGGAFGSIPNFSSNKLKF
jgi:hypothetical protein